MDDLNLFTGGEKVPGWCEIKLTRGGDSLVPAEGIRILSVVPGGKGALG